jgi:hypothetical protein
MFKNAKIFSIGANPEEYHSQPAERGQSNYVMSSSALRMFALCPSKWRNGWELPRSASLEYGSLFDTLMLTPEQFDTRYALIPATYDSAAMKCPKCGSVSEAASCRACKTEREPTTIQKPWNGNSDTCRAWLDAQKATGREVVSADALGDAQSAAKRLLADDQLKRFIEACDKQVWLTADWHDENTGIIVPVKCLLDLAGKADSAFAKSLGDLKTTKNAAPLAWAKWAHYAGYEIQAAWNTDIFVAASQREITNFCFVLSESEFPFETGRRFMSQDLLEPGMDTGDIASGRRQYLGMLKGYCKCVKNNFWPGFDDTDEASADGWTLVLPEPYAEQRRMFAPKFNYETGDTEEAEESDPDLIP